MASAGDGWRPCLAAPFQGPGVVSLGHGVASEAGSVTSNPSGVDGSSSPARFCGRPALITGNISITELLRHSGKLTYFIM